MTNGIFIVMIEDDQDLCDGWSDLFDLLGYEHQIFKRGLDFLNDRAALERCSLVITDYYLPDINGVELIKRVNEIRPNLATLLLTGSRETFIAESIRALPKAQLMHKPLNINEIEAHITKLFAA